MPDFLLQTDRHLFHLINHDFTNSFFDWIMPWLRNPKSLTLLYLIILGVLFWKFRIKAILIIVFIALTWGFADFTSASIIKPIVKRLRPCNDPVVSLTEIRRIDCGTGYSFPSTHATNCFAIAFFMIFLFRKKWRWVWLWGILWAGSISFAQVYVGVHYPIDVFCGALYGILVGWLLYWFYKKSLSSLIISL